MKKLLLLSIVLVTVSACNKSDSPTAISGNEDSSAAISGKENQGMNLDLLRFTLDGNRLGEAISPKSQFFEPLKNADYLEDHRAGIEISTNDNVLDYVEIAIDKFDGSFSTNDSPVALELFDTPSKVKNIFGAPYWEDLDEDGELLLFYVYDNGQYEVQYEFGNGTDLSYIGLYKDGVLSDEQQRSYYGVDKPWPPSSD